MDFAERVLAVGVTVAFVASGFALGHGYAQKADTVVGSKIDENTAYLSTPETYDNLTIIRDKYKAEGDEIIRQRDAIYTEYTNRAQDAYAYGVKAAELLVEMDIKGVKPKPAPVVEEVVVP